MKNIGFKFLKPIFYKYVPDRLQAYISKLVFRPVIGKDVRFTGKTYYYYGDVAIGDHTVVGGYCSFGNIAIGKYTVFAQNFRCLFNHHDYHAFALSNYVINDLCPEELAPADATALLQPNECMRPKTIVGNDVWFGEFVTVQGGIHIGDGAVIGARSVVTHDIPPYAIAVGSPAKVVKYRFDPDTIEFLEKIKWWDWSQEQISRNYWRLCCFDRTLLDDIR